MFSWLDEKIRRIVVEYHDVHCRMKAVHVKELESDIEDFKETIKHLQKEINLLKAKMASIEQVELKMQEYHSSLKNEAQALSKLIEKKKKSSKK